MADGAACTATDRTLVEVLVELIDRHPTNPRNLPREDEPALRLACADIIGTMQVEAGAAVNGRGIRDAVIIRRKGERFELVDGERRYHSARLTGLRRILAEIVVMSDEDVIAEQLRAHGVELTPLEEAGALSRLRDEHKLDVGEIATRTGRTVRLVRKRLALLSLCDDGKTALVSGKLSLGLAEDLATLALPESQAAALGSILARWREGDEPISLRDGRGEVQRQRRTLKTAGFDLADRSLPGGSCLTCPKRSGAQVALFLDGVQDADLCGDAVCFEVRQKESTKRQLEAAAAKRVPIATEKDVKKLFPYGRTLAYDAPMIDLAAPCDVVQPPPATEPVKNAGRKSESADKPCRWGKGGAHKWDDSAIVREDGEGEGGEEDLDDRPAAAAGCEAWIECEACDAWREANPPPWHKPAARGWKRPTWGEVLKLGAEKSGAPAPAPTMVVPVEGKVIELIDRKRAVEALHKAGLIDEKTARSEIREASPAKPSELDRWQIEAKALDAARTKALETIGEKAKKKTPDVKFWRFVAGMGLRRARSPEREAVVEALGLTAKSATERNKAIADAIAKADEAGARSIAVLLLAASWVDVLGEADQDTPAIVACRFFGLDFEALLAEATRDVKAEAKAKAKKAKAAAPAKAKKSPAKASPPAEEEDEDEAEGDDLPTSPAAARREAAEERAAGAAEHVNELVKRDERRSAKAKRCPNCGETAHGACVVIMKDALAPAQEAAAPAPAAQACPIDEEAVRRLAKAAGVTIESRAGGLPPWIEPAAVWACAQKVFAHVEAAHPVEVPRTELVAALPSAGTDPIDIACALLVGERKLHRAGGKTAASGGWRYSLKNPPLPGQAGQGPTAPGGITERVAIVDFIANRATSLPPTKTGRENAKALMDASFKIGRLDVVGVTAAALEWLEAFSRGPLTHSSSLAVLDVRAAIERGEHRAEADPASDERLLRAVLHAVGAKGRARKQVILACRDFPAADVEAGIGTLIARGALVERDGKLTKRGEP